MQIRNVITLVACLSVCLLVFEAKAGEPTAEDKAAAKVAFSEGQKHFDEGQFDKAAISFRQAMTLMPTWKIYYNIGHSEAAARNYGLALEAFQLYLAEAGDRIPTDREEETFGQITELQKKVGSLKVIAPDGSEIYVDDTLRGVAPLAGSIKIVAGKEHQVIIKLEDEVLLEQKVRVWNDETISLEAKVEEEAPVPVVPEEVVAPVEEEQPTVEEQLSPTEPVEETKDKAVKEEKKEPAKKEPIVVKTLDQKHPLRVTGAVLLTIGTIGVVGGAATGVVAIIKKKDLEENCNSANMCPPDDGLGTTQMFATMSTLGLAIGGGLVTTGIVLMIVGRRLERKSLTSLNATPVFTPDFAGLTLSGRF